MIQQPDYRYFIASSNECMASSFEAPWTFILSPYDSSSPANNILSGNDINDIKNNINIVYNQLNILQLK